MQELFVEKFGGASVNSSDAVRNVEKILKSEVKKRVVVISAMGKTTNKLENIVNQWYNSKTFLQTQYEELKDYHYQIIDNLFGQDNKTCREKIDFIFNELTNHIHLLPSEDYNFLYDSIVSFGECISTTIVSEYLRYKGLNNSLVSAIEIIRTDNNYRDANVDWERTTKACNKVILPLLETCDLVITQGFIGGSKEMLPTTLGREGSDYSAAIIANCLQAKSMTIWKDVAGLLNADPKRLKETTKLNSIPFNEAIELAYYGASIIHPKSIKPLENKLIPLYIKSFLSPQSEGSIICSNPKLDPVVPNYIFKDKQLLLSIMPKDLSFMAESNIAKVFEVLAKNKIKVNMIQNSAISFSVCFDENMNLLPQVLQDLQQNFKVRYNRNLQLITIRHYTEQSIKNVTTNKKILIKQVSRKTIQVLVEN